MRLIPAHRLAISRGLSSSTLLEPNFTLLSPWWPHVRACCTFCLALSEYWLLWPVCSSLRLIADSHPIPNTMRLLSPHLSPSNTIGIMMSPSHPVPSRLAPFLPILEALPACPSPLSLCTLLSACLQLSQGASSRSTRLDSTLHSTQPTNPHTYIHISTSSHS